MSHVFAGRAGSRKRNELLEVVAKRDGWQCRMCRCILYAGRIAGNSATLDHIRPVRLRLTSCTTRATSSWSASAATTAGARRSKQDTPMTRPKSRPKRPNPNASGSTVGPCRGGSESLQGVRRKPHGDLSFLDVIIRTGGQMTESQLNQWPADKIVRKNVSKLVFLCA